MNHPDFLAGVKEPDLGSFPTATRRARKAGMKRKPFRRSRAGGMKAAKVRRLAKKL